MTISPGQLVTYYPPPADKHDNRHFPAVVEEVGKRVKIRAYMQDFPAGKIIHTTSKRLIANQQDFAIEALTSLGFR